MILIFIYVLFSIDDITSFCNEKIETTTFYRCKGLVNVTLGKNVKVIDSSAFADCQSLVRINIPEGMEAVLLNQVLKVRLRGPAGVMNALQPEDVAVIVDFSGKELGSFTIKPTITVRGETFAKVGPVGTYSVSATLREKPVEETEGE